jgi:hypothetical protein
VLPLVADVLSESWEKVRVGEWVINKRVRTGGLGSRIRKFVTFDAHMRWYPTKVHVFESGVDSVKPVLDLPNQWVGGPQVRDGV